MNQPADCEIPTIPLWASIVAVAQAIRILIERRCRWYERPTYLQSTPTGSIRLPRAYKSQKSCLIAID